MEVRPQKIETPKIKDKIEVLQGMVNIFRDLSIFSVLFLLVIVPKFMHQKLSDAGFVKGEIAGWTWEKQLGKTDGKLIEAAKQIDSLKKRLEDTTKIVGTNGNEVDAQNKGIEKQLEKNKQAIQEANSLSHDIQNTLKDNTPLLNPKVNAETGSLVQIVNEYKIQIFYTKENPGQREAAMEIKNALEEIGVKSTMQVLARPSSIDRASSNQIRYYAATEREVAFALQQVLAQSYSKTSFKLQTVYTPSPGWVSIFLKS